MVDMTALTTKRMSQLQATPLCPEGDWIVDIRFGDWKTHRKDGSLMDNGLVIATIGGAPVEPLGPLAGGQEFVDSGASSNTLLRFTAFLRSEGDWFTLAQTLMEIGAPDRTLPEVVQGLKGLGLKAVASVRHRDNRDGEREAQISTLVPLPK